MGVGCCGVGLAVAHDAGTGMNRRDRAVYPERRMTQQRPELPNPPRRPPGPAPQEGVRVVDFTRVLAAPFGTHILGDLGADVVKIDNSKAVDDTLSVTPDAVICAAPAIFPPLNPTK